MMPAPSVRANRDGFSCSRKRFCQFLSFLILNLVLLIPCRAADVVSVTTPNNPRSADAQLDLASQLYGLEVQTINAESAGDARNVVVALAKPETVAAVISARALPARNTVSGFAVVFTFGDTRIAFAIQGWLHAGPVVAHGG